MSSRLKACPRCNGRKWTYYKGHKCQVCKGNGKAPASLYRCEAMACVAHRGKLTVRRCQNVTEKSFEGRHYCHMHNPKNNYAGYRRFVEAHRASKQLKLPGTKATDLWLRQHARMVACAKKNRKERQWKRSQARRLSSS